VNYSKQERKGQDTTVNIGDWNMDTTALVNVAHGLADNQKIRSYHAFIRDDAGTAVYPLDTFGSTTFDVGLNQFELNRTVGLAFDTTDFDATGYNRGNKTRTITNKCP